MTTATKTRNKMIRARLTEAEFDSLVASSAAKGFGNLSAYVRKCLGFSV